MNIPDSVEGIGDFNFCNCSELINITVPQSVIVNNIGMNTFDNLKDEAVIHFLGTMEEWASYTNEAYFEGTFTVECLDGNYTYN